MVWYEQIAALQAELSKERQHSREQAGRIAVLADQAQRLQLAQMQPQQIEDCVAPAEPERQQPERPGAGGADFGVNKRGDEILLETTQIKQRLPFIDLIRGITIIEMISYHFLWDLVYLYNADIPWYKSHGAYIWQQSICWTFILLAGFSWHLGKNT